MTQRAVALLSGGLDSATATAVARDLGFEVHALSIDYGQRHRQELIAARAVAHQLGCASHKVVSVNLRSIGGSALTDDYQVPDHRGLPAPTQEIPITYVPARNTIFLSIALGLAEVIGAQDLFIGVTAIDYSGYPDCRPEFIRAFEKLASLATKATVADHQRLTVHAPLIDLGKAEIIAWGIRLGVDYSLTRSCYNPLGDIACGRCDACAYRQLGFESLGVPDPIRYLESASSPPPDLGPVR